MSWQSCLASLLLSCAAASALTNTPPSAPTITEPHLSGQILNPEDVHMECGPFSDPDPGDTHRCSDWEIWTVSPSERVWSALCATGLSRVHIHLGDGTFEGSHAGRLSLLPSTNYLLRTRHRDSSNDPLTEWGPYASRPFTTGSLSTIFPLQLQDVASTPAPLWTNSAGAPITLPMASTPPSLTLESSDGAPLLDIRAGAGGNQVTNPPSLGGHADVRLRIPSGAAPLLLPESTLEFTDDHGADHTIYLPAIDLLSGQTLILWIAPNGSTFYGQASQTEPDFTSFARGAPVPWTCPPGYRIDVFASGFQLPVNIAFIPNAGPNPTDPFFYVTELYGNIKVVRRNGTVGTYAGNLLNFNPTGIFPGSGEQGLTGIVVEPATGDVIAAYLYDSAPPDGDHYPKVVRFHSTDGGQTAVSQTTILDMAGEIQGQSHQVSNCTIGPDGKLYVHMGDGFDTTTGQNMSSFRGKILRMNLNGSAPSDNPFYNAGNGITATDYIYALGLRNPFGGAWRALDNAHYEVENGPNIDRFAKVMSGRNFGWDDTPASMYNWATYNWEPAAAPVNIAFIQPSTFGGSGFPSDRYDHAFVTISGATWETGFDGKEISEFKLDADGDLLEAPTPFVSCNTTGKATAVGLTAGPDGLYFTDLYRDQGYVSPADAGANVLRIRWVGIADFKASKRIGPPAMTVQFTDTSSVPSPTAWFWTFGDGGTSTQQNPSHVYTAPGVYDVRFSVTGSAGTAVVQKSGHVRVSTVPDIAVLGGPASPTPADAAAIARLQSRGFAVHYYRADPAFRPDADQLCAAHDLLVVPSTAVPEDIGGEFTTQPIPMLFWQSQLLQSGWEPLVEFGAAASATNISLVNTSHPITQGLSAGVHQVFTPDGAMSLGEGARPPGTTVLATQAGQPAEVALAVADAGASLIDGYTTPARRVFMFFENTSYSNATADALTLFDRSICWAMNGSPAIFAQPQPVSSVPGDQAIFTVTTSAYGPLTLRWRRNGVNLSNNGHYSGTTTATLTISNVTAADAGSYDCVVTSPCGSITSAGAALTVGTTCYPNCDGSTTPPILNVADFTCFLQKYASNDPYANCDQSTTPPVLNVADFTCFLQKYATGCR